MTELLLAIIGLFFLCAFINILPTPGTRYKHLVSKRTALLESKKLV